MLARMPEVTGLTEKGSLGLSAHSESGGPQKGSQLFLKLWKLSATQALSPLGSGWERKGLEFSLLPTHCSPSMTAGTDLGSSFRVDLLGHR